MGRLRPPVWHVGRPDLLLEPELRAQVAGFLEPRVERLESGSGVRETLAFLNDRVLGDRVERRLPSGSPNEDLVRVAETLATAAWSDMSAAFSLWCHRMVLEYLSFAPQGSALRTAILPRVRRTELLGSTALAAAMAHHVSKAPLPIQWRAEGDTVVLDGRVNWASNLFPPDFVMVTAAAQAGDGHVRIVAVAGETDGLCIDPYPRLLALQATGSSSLALRDVRLRADWVITDDPTAFLTRVRPIFLLLQSSFCWGLASRSLTEARRGLHSDHEIFCDDLEALEQRSVHVAGLIRSGLHDRGMHVPMRDLVRLRLESAQLAAAAVTLEAKVVGGRGYAMASPTARRLREAAFLPVQAPTEGQLRWELSRSV